MIYFPGLFALSEHAPVSSRPRDPLHLFPRAAPRERRRHPIRALPVSDVMFMPFRYAL